MLVIVIASLVALLVIQGSCTFDASGYSFLTKINVTTQTMPFEDEDVLIRLDTKSMISGDKLRSNCADMVFVLQRTDEVLDHWLETDCDTVDTRIYVTLNVSTVDSENLLLMYHRKADVYERSDVEWDGRFFTMTNDTCTGEWTYSSELNGKFPLISVSGSAGTSDPATFDHFHVMVGESSTPTATETASIYPGTANIGTDAHTHQFVVITDGISTLEEVLPPYIRTVFCKSPTNKMMKWGINLYFSASSLPEGVAYFDETLGKLNYGSTSYGASGGTPNHAHTFSGLNGGSVYGTSQMEGVDTDEDDRNCLGSDHLHTISGTTVSFSNVPSHVDIVFGINYLDRGTDNVLSELSFGENIHLVNSIPPKGFEFRKAILNNYPGYFISSGATSGVQYGGQTSGSVPHQHTYTSGIPAPSTSYYITVDRASGGGQPWRLHNLHQHNVDVTSTSSNVVLPNYKLAVVIRKDVRANVSIGVAVQIDDIEEYVDPTDDTCASPCLNGGSCTLNVTTDTWYCNCADGWIGSVCGVVDDTEEPVDYSPYIIGGISAGVAVLFVCCVVVLIFVGIVMFVVLKRKKDRSVSTKMMSNLVTGAEKELELKEEKDKLEEEKNKLMEQRKSLALENAKERLEKEALRDALEELKKQKTSGGSQSISAVKDIKDKEVTRAKKLVTDPLLKYVSYKGKYQKKFVMYRVFPNEIFNNSTFNLKQVLNLEVKKYGCYDHPNIVKYLAFSYSPVGVVSEWTNQGSILMFFRRKKRKTLRFLEKVRLFYEVASAVQFLHKQGLRHGDIRAENVFLTNALKPKVDFGFNICFNKQHKYSAYSAPELIIPQPVEDDEDDDDDDSEEEDLEQLPIVKSDIYAFGILMLEIVAENFNLYKVEKGKKVAVGEKAAKDPTFRPTLGKMQKYYPNWFVNLLKMCWSANLNQRPTISRIKSIIETIVFDKE